MNSEEKAARARRSQIIHDTYVAWAAEQAGSFEPAEEWAARDPSQYDEAAELLSADPDAERDLFERTRLALADAEFGEVAVE